MISVKHLSKYYGEHLAVEDMSLEIEQGHVYGFLGPNGAGKSTTMNIIAGCLSASSGTVLVDGYDIFEEPDEAKRCIGYLPEHPPLYLNESVSDYLKFVGEAKGLRGKELDWQIRKAMERTGIEAVAKRRIGQLSKGYRQRVGIAQALLGNPKVMILDEPTVGLDPIQILEIRDLIRELGKTHTVIFSSHILSEVQTICDRILMIAHGRVVACGTPEELRSQLASAGELQVLTDAGDDQIRTCLAGLTLTEEPAIQPEGDLHAVHIPVSGDTRELAGRIFHAFAAHGFTIYELSRKQSSLEEVFLELSGEGETPRESGMDSGENRTAEEEPA